jgi:hypothetical protein
MGCSVTWVCFCGRYGVFLSGEYRRAGREGWEGVRGEGGQEGGGGGVDREDRYLDHRGGRTLYFCGTVFLWLPGTCFILLCFFRRFLYDERSGCGAMVEAGHGPGHARGESPT